MEDKNELVDRWCKGKLKKELVEEIKRLQEANLMGRDSAAKCEVCNSSLVPCLCGPIKLFVDEDKPTMEVAATEYLRRNLVAAKAMGVRAGLKCISNRLHDSKNSPLWLLTIVENELSKTSDICDELAKHRDEVKSQKVIIDSPTRGQITDACLSYRHDYGLMDRAEREKLRADAARWRGIWDDVLGEER